MTKKKNTKRRLQPSARTPQLLHDQHPLYEYALKEYAQTVAPHPGGFPAAPSSVAYSRAKQDPAVPQDLQQDVERGQGFQPDTTASNNVTGSGGLSSSGSNDGGYASYMMQQSANNANQQPSSSVEPSKSFGQGTSIHPAESSASMLSVSPRYYLRRSRLEENLVQTVHYQESYGDAYTGAPMRYVYPKGYQSMRPRSGPWRVSVVLFLLFTWMSIFVVGHCSDQYNADYLYNANELYGKNVDDAAANAMTNIEDDSLLIELRWCGSRPLYLMWLASMLITGLSASYCGVIGYIKCRDFAVANARSQPCGYNVQQVAGPNSDYYLELNADQPDSAAAMSVQNLYQSDGNPQFWGSQIYRPTQAAVAVTSR